MVVFTFGYQGRSIGNYVDHLRRHRVGVVADVRELPWSRKPGFSKTRMSAALAEGGIGYQHFRSAGNPAENRKTAASPADCLHRFREILETDGKRLDPLVELIESADRDGNAVCLTCYELDAHDCHRSIVAEMLARRLPGLDVVHLA